MILKVTIGPGTDPVSNMPAMIISANSKTSVGINNWNGILGGDTVQLYARKIVNGVGSQYQSVGWNGTNEILDTTGWTLGPAIQVWPTPSGSFSMKSFPLDVNTQWAILPQLGPIGGSSPQSPNLGVTTATIVAGGSTQITLSNVASDGNGGTGNIIVTVVVEDGSGA